MKDGMLFPTGCITVLLTKHPSVLARRVRGDSEVGCFNIAVTWCDKWTHVEDIWAPSSAVVPASRSVTIKLLTFHFKCSWQGLYLISQMVSVQPSVNTLHVRLRRFSLFMMFQAVLFDESCRDNVAVIWYVVITPVCPTWGLIRQRMSRAAACRHFCWWLSLSKDVDVAALDLYFL